VVKINEVIIHLKEYKFKLRSAKKLFWIVYCIATENVCKIRTGLVSV